MAEDLEEGIQNSLYLDLPGVGPITKEMVQVTQENSRFYGGGARIEMGRVWTTEDYEARKQRVLSNPLP